MMFRSVMVRLGVTSLFEGSHFICDTYGNCGKSVIPMGNQCVIPMAGLFSACTSMYENSLSVRLTDGPQRPPGRGRTDGNRQQPGLDGGRTDGTHRGKVHRFGQNFGTRLVPQAAHAFSFCVGPLPAYGSGAAGEAHRRRSYAHREDSYI